MFIVPVATAAVVVRHPPDPATATDLGDRLPLYIGIHVALLLLLPLLGLVLWVLLRDIENTPATVSRVLVVPAVAYYAAFDAGMHGDENLHLAVTELLAEYGREHGPRFEPVRVIGDVWSPRSHELRDLLTRNGLPFGFYPADSDEGRSLLAAADLDGTRLPVVLLADGRTLVDPSTSRAAATSALISTWVTRPTTSPSSEPGRPASPRPSTPAPKDCARSSSNARPSAARPAPAR